MTELGLKGNWRFQISRHRKPISCNGFTSMTITPYEIYHPERGGRVVVTCDHATNRVPDDVAGGDLGLSDEDMNRHIAYDVGAAGVARVLADRLGAPAILSDFSRLVIDPNRGEDDPTLIMKLYDGTIIPANRGVDAAERERRMAMLYTPYHVALGKLLEAHPEPIVIAVHSFTRQLRGKAPRPWHVGVLSATDRRLTAPLLARLAMEEDLIVGDNEPYSGHLDGDSIDRHAMRHGRLNALIEVCQDLISEEEDQRHWGERLAPLVAGAIEDVTGESHG